jgi:hypothetical protein
MLAKKPFFEIAAPPGNSAAILRISIEDGRDKTADRNSSN